MELADHSPIPSGMRVARSNHSLQPSQTRMGIPNHSLELSRCRLELPICNLEVHGHGLETSARSPIDSDAERTPEASACTMQIFREYAQDDTRVGSCCRRRTWLVLPRRLSARLRHRVFAVFVHLYRRGAGHGQLVYIRREFVVGIQDVFARDGLADVDGHAAHARHQTRFAAAADFVVRLILA